MKNIFISIIVPVYNVSDYLIRFMDSIRMQTSDDFETIFVDDGSTDDSLDKLKNYNFEEKNITIISKSNTGVGDSRNTGLKSAKGHYVYFADPDDFLSENLIKTLEIKINSEPDILIFGYNKLYEDNNIKSPIFNKIVGLLNKQQFQDDFKKIESENNFNSIWNKIYSRKFLLDNSFKFPDNKTAQDAIFNYDIINYAQKIQIIEDTLYNYISYRPNSAQNKNKKKYKDEFCLMLKKRNIFEVWKCKDKQFLMDQAIVDFFATQIITYRGKFPRALISSMEFQKAKKMLNQIKIKNIDDRKLKIKLFLLKIKGYRILYYIYSKYM